MHRSPSLILDSVDAADVCAPVDTPIGRLFVAVHGTIVIAVGRTAATVEASVQSRLGRLVRRAPALPEPLAQAVAAQIRGDDPGTLSFDLSDRSDLERAAPRAVLEIPRGAVRSYGQIAQQIGQPRAAKDVGLALGQNPIPLLIPCHRVVYSDGRVGGYIFGSRAKQMLLLAEGAQVAGASQLELDLRVA